MFKKITATILSFMLLIFMSFGVYAQVAYFSDMPQDWSKTALENAVDNGLLQGAYGKIMPKEILARAVAFKNLSDKKTNIIKEFY